ncbi:MAG: hypothetical protein F6K09_21475, partial [Merismopedia sp. SIO2A8]|nr:hypothetical protein [Merismopedia sp. SIO2A8]
MASKIQPEMYTQSLVEAAQWGNIEAIASLLQQTLTVTQPQLLPTITVQETMNQVVAEASDLPHVVIGSYDSQLTEQGVLVTRIETSLLSPWQKRTQPTPNSQCVPITRLLNRQAEVKAAIATLHAGGTIEFSGEPGIGKTALLRALSHHPQLTLRFPGGMVYQRVYERPIDDVLQSIFEALYQPRQDGGGTKPSLSTSTFAASDPSRLYKPLLNQIQSLLEQQHIGVVLDELGWREVGFSPSGVLPNVPLLLATVMPSGHPVSHPVGMSKVQQFALTGLPLQEAIVLFEEGLGRSLQPRESQLVEQLCQQLEGYPRRLVQYAALVRHRQYGLKDLLEQLRSGMEPEEVVFQWMSGLHEVDRSIIAILAALRGIPLHPIHLPTLVNLGLQADSIDASLQQLLDHGVVGSDGTYF